MNPEWDEPRVNVEDGVKVGDGDGVNTISKSSNGLFGPFIGNAFVEVEDAQVFL